VTSSTVRRLSAADTSAQIDATTRPSMLTM